MKCSGSITDQWRTVWRCELDAHDTGLCRRGVMQWSTPGIGDRPGYVLREAPVDFYQWDGGEGDVPDWVPVDGINEVFGSLRLRTGESSYTHVFPREWIVRWSRGHGKERLSTVRPDEFEQRFEARDA